MGFLRIAGIIVVAAALFAGVLGAPSAGIEDEGDWGSVSEERTEVITTVWIDNPNPVGITLGDSVSVSYQLYLNDVNLASGEKAGIRIPSGNNTVQTSTYIQNRKIQPWWVAFVQNNETVTLGADATVSVSGPVSASTDISIPERTLLEDETPVITSLSGAASGFEGRHTESVSRERLLDRTGIEWTGLLAGGYVTEGDTEATVGYEIQDAWAEWGAVNEETTTVYFNLRVHNPGDVPVPATPDHLGADVEMNDVEMFSAQANDTSLQNPDDFATGEVIGERVIRPGETKVAVYAVEMDNEKVDDWFRSHVSNDERTDVRTELQVVFTVGELAFSIPEDNPVAYTCQLQTAILVDDQNTTTNCGDGPGAVAGRG
jgi:LEA14-like dessication related protein